MKNYSISILIMVFVFLTISCNEFYKQDPEDKKKINLINQANWLIGKWQNISTEGIATEIWIKINDSTYNGKSYFVIAQDTVSSETICMQQVGKDLLYIPRVKNQNDNQPITFKSIKIEENLLIFENLKHDFPQIISYSLITSDSIVAEISGEINGKKSIQKFPMKKIKQN